jgi:hypothetical protein
MEEYEKVQMLKSTESVATSSFVDVGEMEKSGQSLEIVSPVDSTPCNLLNQSATQLQKEKLVLLVLNHLYFLLWEHQFQPQSVVFLAK